MRIERRKDNRLGPQHPESSVCTGTGRMFLRLTGPPIESRQFAADDDVWVERIGNDRNHIPPPQQVASRRNVIIAFVAATLDSDLNRFPVDRL